MIFVIEGADGTGKSTLAEKLAKRVDGMVVHATFNKVWDMERYHIVLIKAARDLDEIGISAVLDRWAPSEEVYGSVFRKGPSFDTGKLISKYRDDITWIFCRNDNAAANHKVNKKKRDEMFDDMSKVSEAFDKYVFESALPWHVFDYDKDDVEKFLQKFNAQIKVDIKWKDLPS